MCKRGDECQPVAKRRKIYKSSAKRTSGVNPRISITFKVIVECRANKDEIIEVKDGKLKIKLRALPVQGKANQSLIKFLSRQFKIKKENIRILLGRHFSEKVIRIKNIDQNYLKNFKI